MGVRISEFEIRCPEVAPWIFPPDFASRGFPSPNSVAQIFATRVSES